MQWWFGRDQRFSASLNYHEHVYKTPDKQDHLIVLNFHSAPMERYAKVINE